MAVLRGLCRFPLSKLISSNFTLSGQCQCSLLLLQVSKPTNLYLYEAKREASIFTTLTGEEIWKGVTSVSNAGKKRGRGKGSKRRIAIDLNRGQITGIGVKKMIWPGLTHPVIKGKELITQKQLPPDPEHLEKLIQKRSEMGRFKRIKLSPLERGWSGGKMHGRHFGPPDPIGEDTFEGFDSVILEMRRVCKVTGNFGRITRYRILMVTGNGNGLIGFSTSTNSDARVAIRRAKNKAAQRLRYIERFEDHTVLHDFFTQFAYTKLHVSKKPKGYGLVCHRALREMCRLIGITDLYAKIEGSVRIMNLTKAFLLGLQKQKTMEELAEAMGLHLVEFSKENGYYPRVLASPTKCRTASQIPANEITDYNEIIHEGRQSVRKLPPVAFYKKLPGYQIHLHKTQLFRNSLKTRTALTARYGEVTSFLNLREAKKQEAEVQESTVTS